jgi:vacuolar protein sorting-associated protein 13A/C
LTLIPQDEWQFLTFFSAEKKLFFLNKFFTDKLEELADTFGDEKSSTFIDRSKLKILDNLHISVKNLHIRIEDNTRKPYYSLGFVLKELVVVNTNEQWEEIFIDRNKQKDIDVFKLLKITKFGFYLNTNETVMISLNDPKDYRMILTKTEEDLDYLIKPISLSAKMKQNNTQKELCTYNEDNLSTALARIHFWINLENFDIDFEKAQFDVIIRIVNHVSNHMRFQYFHHESRKFYFYRPEDSVKEKPKLWWRYAIRTVVKRMKYLQGNNQEFDLNQMLLSHYKTLFRLYFAKYMNDPKPYESGTSCDYRDMFNRILTIVDLSLLNEWALENVQEYFQNNRKEKNKKAKLGFLGGIFGSKKINEEDLLTPEEEEKILEFIETTKKEVKNQALTDSKAIKLKIEFSLNEGSFNFTKLNNNITEAFGFKYRDLNFILMNSSAFTEVEAFLKEFNVEMTTGYGKGNVKSNQITFYDNIEKDEFVWKLNFRHNSPESAVNSRLDLQIVI